MVALMSGYAYSWLIEDQPRLTADKAVNMLARFILPVSWAGRAAPSRRLVPGSPPSGTGFGVI